MTAADLVQNYALSRDRQQAETLMRTHADNRADTEAAIRQLETQLTRLARRLEEMYDDKLDGRITAEVYDRRAAKGRREQEQLRAAIDRHKGDRRSYLLEGVKLLDLARRAPELFERQESREKRRLLNFLLSNCTWKNGSLHAEFRQPFDMLAVATKAAGGFDTGGGNAETVSEKWLLR